METPHRRPVVDVIENRLREDVLTDRCPVGGHLSTERRLAQVYSVNRATFRHVSGRLPWPGPTAGAWNTPEEHA